ncbi:MAG TPA: N-acetylmuramoyl-L-alanine amidase [Candidatus Babeliales bacterium]|nr:N-acetylmuramoyl-L-alanine amidase [Candidatus Babeliales bacterium]
MDRRSSAAASWLKQIDWTVLAIYGCSVLLLTWVSALNATVRLEKFYEHLGQHTDKIVFYFDQRPPLQHSLVPLLDAPKLYRSEKFFFPSVQFGNAGLKRALHSFQAQHQRFYRLKFKQVKGGVELVLVYDIRQVQCVQCHRFKAISGFDGLVLKIEHLPSHKAQRSSAPAPAPSPLKLVLDYGHGGTDVGTQGVSPQPEKILTRLVGLKLKSLLVAQGFMVLETRSADTTVALDARTTFANLAGGVAAFISLHANHAGNPQAAGIEIYYADDHLLNRVALHSLATACRFNLPGEPSKALAETVLKAMLAAVADYGTKNRQVRCSMSQVLLGTENMLAILIEMGYLSHAAEAALLNDEQYQWRLAQGIANGIQQYFKVVVK